MTDQKMPDEIYASRMTVGTLYGTWSSLYKEGDSYTRTDLYTAALAERDALRALCEGMAGAIADTKAEFQRLKDAVMEREDMGFIGKMKDAVYLDAVMAVVETKSEQALAAYEKHKGVG